MTRCKDDAVKEIKQQIEDGTYDETDPAKLKAVVDGVLGDNPKDEPVVDGLLRCAVFAEPDETTLVLRSATRRLDVVFGPNDETLKLVAIDENMKADVKVLYGSEAIPFLREAVEWVDPEDDE